MNIYLQAAAILAVTVAVVSALIGYIIWAASRKTTAGTVVAAVPLIIVVMTGMYFMVLGMLMGY